MTNQDNRTLRNHDDILEEIAVLLDIPPSKFEEAKSRYESVGTWLSRAESRLGNYKPVISPQGSFLLGTVIRPIGEGDEYDVDLVCLLDATKTEFTQKELKEAVGTEIEAYARAQNMKTPPKEGRRCWTLHYTGDAQFHMDILPALPDAARYKQKLEERGFGELAKDIALSGEAIAITDWNSPQYFELSEDWPQSNPKGFAAWFRGRMVHQLNERKKAFAKRHMITESIDEIPDYKVKTPLQQAIQLLKRHRNSMFVGDEEHKPISIIITTLAALAYNEEATVTAALESILRGMDQNIENRNGTVWISNPVFPAENFADKWAEKPEKRDNFYKWLAKARNDFALYLRASAFNTVPEVLEEALGKKMVQFLLASAVAPIEAPAIIKSRPDVEGPKERAEAAIDQIRRSETSTKPWTK